MGGNVSTKVLDLRIRHFEKLKSELRSEQQWKREMLFFCYVSAGLFLRVANPKSKWNQLNFLKR